MGLAVKGLTRDPTWMRMTIDRGRPIWRANADRQMTPSMNISIILVVFRRSYLFFSIVSSTRADTRCYFSYGFSVSVTVVIYQLQLKLLFLVSISISVSYFAYNFHRCVTDGSRGSRVKKCDPLSSLVHVWVTFAIRCIFQERLQIESPMRAVCAVHSMQPSTNYFDLLFDSWYCTFCVGG